MSSKGNQATATFVDGALLAGEWVRVDPDGFVESGAIVGGECISNPPSEQNTMAIITKSNDSDF